MQIATLTYRYKPKEKDSGDSRAKLCRQHILTTIANSSKKSKPRQSLHSHLPVYSNKPLPAIARNGQHRSSIQIKGSSLPSSKLGDSSAYSFHHQSRSHSRQSNKSETPDGRSRSITPTGLRRPASKLIRVKFGYPIKLRSADFYGPDKSEAELHLREESFVNDSIRSVHQNHRSSIIPYYEALDDPHLRRFFQSPIVLDIVRKTLNVESNSSYKQNDRSSQMKKRAKSNDLYDKRNDDYLRIVTKGSSGYAKLNGYDCIPSYAPARHHVSTVDLTASNSQAWNNTDSRLNHSNTQDKNRTLTNTSVTSFPTDSSNQFQKQQKKNKTRKFEQFQQRKPVAKSSPLRHLVEATTSNIKSSSTMEMNAHPMEEKSESAGVSTISQDEQ